MIFSIFSARLFIPSLAMAESGLRNVVERFDNISWQGPSGQL
jgi:hypothetical protein